jgi:predicted MFS family arabinose efflux permease
VLATGISGAAALLVFGRVEARRRAPLFDVTALRRRRVLGGVSTLLANYFSLLGVLFVVPQYLQYVHGESALVAGLTLAPLGAGTVITAPFSGRIRARLGTRLTIAGPLVATVGGFALLLFLGGGASVALVVISMAVFGSAIALFAPPATAVIMDDLGEAKAGDGGAINQLARQVGGALGVAVVGSVFAAVYAAKVDHVLQSFPSASRNVAAKSIEEAKEVISSVPATVHEHLLPRVTHAFDLGARAGIAVAVIVLLAAATVVMVTLRSSATSRG